jgi:hypothetical protein
MTILILDDEKKAGEFYGGEALPVYRYLKEAKRKTSRSYGYVSVHVPEEWIDSAMEAAQGIQPKYNLLLVRIPVDKTKKKSEE